MIQTFQYRRAREYTCRGGLGTQMISEPVEAAVRDRSARLLRALKWEGVVGVEFKLPADRPACPVLLEINPRCPGTIELSRAAGVNFPLLHFKLTVGEQVPSRQIAYRCGVRYHRWLMDSLSLIELLWDRPAVTGVPLPGRARAIWDYLRFYGPGVCSDTFQPRDPLPGLVEIWEGLPVVAGRLGRTLWRRLNGARRA